ncbi:hypothetical protein DNTS_000064 [Danionella cerebrum]|uniref:TNFR-Cys domain-containing protein n=1 Tax=Danionella cerebrum TaxID=2873325 RepID=A0A553PXC3_9TELE|nr:hypothetical protein DNTS_000064 [Danionella translucida]
MYMDMLMLRYFFMIISTILFFETCFCGCPSGEYDINGECCPMCSQGNHVTMHCTENTSTNCAPCPTATYLDKPSGLEKCFPCTACSSVNGITIRDACTRSSDTICEAEKGHFCLELNKGSCVIAVKHKKCNPGEYIKQTGTLISDTVCDDCTDATYSNGSLTSCLPHSKCELLGLKEVKAGTPSSDADCQSATPVGLIVGVTIFVVHYSSFVALLGEAVVLY